MSFPTTHPASEFLDCLIVQYHITHDQDTHLSLGDRYQEMLREPTPHT